MCTSARSADRPLCGSLRKFRRRWFFVGHTTQFLALFVWMAAPLGAEYRPDSYGNPVWFNSLGIPDLDDAPPEGPDLSDSDSDTLPNWFEDYLGTDKYNPDSDDDLITDGDEITVTQTNPLQAD